MLRGLQWPSKSSPSSSNRSSAGKPPSLISSHMAWGVSLQGGLHSRHVAKPGQSRHCISLPQVTGSGWTDGLSGPSELMGFSPQMSGIIRKESAFPLSVTPARK